VFSLRYGHSYRVELYFEKDRTVDNVQNRDSYINIPSSEVYRIHIGYNRCGGFKNIGSYSTLH
jgi:hypothetical protein